MDPRWAASLGNPGRQGVVNPAGHRSSHPPQQGWGLLSGGVSILSAARPPCRGLLGAPSLELPWNVWRDTLSSPGDKLCQGVGGNRVFKGRHPQACSSSPCTALVHLQTLNLPGGRAETSRSLLGAGRELRQVQSAPRGGDNKASARPQGPL